MAKDSIIADEMSQVIGLESGESVYEIEKEPIRRWAEAIGDPNPLYHDEEYAKAHGYRSVIAPPGFFWYFCYCFPIKIGKEIERPEGKTTTYLNGGQVFELFKTVQAGDIITKTEKIADIYEREGRLGKMIFTIIEFTYKNQQGEIAAKCLYTEISY